MGAVANTNPLVRGAEDSLSTMLERLAELVTCESPSHSLQHLRTCAELIRPWLAAAVQRPVEIADIAGKPHLLAAADNPRVLVLGHFDTVWPAGTTVELPFSVVDGIARGPGVFDMKAGITQAIAAIELLDDQTHVSVLLTSDEEVGSTTSRALITEQARRAGAVLVCEPSADGAAVKTGRKGIANYSVNVHGRAAHAGLEPHLGANAGIELAHQVLAITALGTAETAVTPTVLSAGTTVNTVPEIADCAVDVRSWSTMDLEAVDTAMRALTTSNPDTQLIVTGGIDRPPFAPEAAESLYQETQRAARQIGLTPPAAVFSGGGSDGNITAADGIPTLDGLGAVGRHPHGRNEFVEVTAMPRQTSILAALLARLQSNAS